MSNVDILEMREAMYWRLPHEAQEHIRVFGTPLPSPRFGVIVRWRMADYRIAELSQMLQRRTK